MKTFAKGLVTGVILMLMVAATNVAWNAWSLQVRDTATIGGHKSGTPEILGKLTVESDTASEKTLVIKQRASQTADSIEVQNSSGSELFSVDKDGDVSCVNIAASGTVALTGAAAFSGDVTLGDSTSDTITATGGLTSSNFFAVPTVTSDPCPGYASLRGAAAMKRAIFHNGTSDYLCRCDASTDDYKLDADTDGSAVNCF
jgi:hypothetical protein